LNYPIPVSAATGQAKSRSRKKMKKSFHKPKRPRRKAVEKIYPQDILMQIPCSPGRKKGFVPERTA
jgi:hypothetical protein